MFQRRYRYEGPVGNKTIQLHSLLILIVFFYMFLAIVNKYGGKSVPTFPKPTNLRDSKLENVCLDILQISKRNNSYLSDTTTTTMTVNEISRSKTDGEFIFYEYYYQLSYLIPSIIINSTTENGTKFSINKKSRLELLDYNIPYLNCPLRKYEHQDVASCLKMKLQDSETFHISFIGDSRVRIIMEVLLELIKSFQLTITTAKGDQLTLDDFLGEKGTILWPKYKENLSITSALYRNFLITYFWAPYLSKGDDEYEVPEYKKWLKNNTVFEDLLNFGKKIEWIPVKNETEFTENFVSHYSKNKTILTHNLRGKSNGATDEFRRLLKKKVLPDYIIIDTGTWELSSPEDIYSSIDNKSFENLKKMYRVLDRLASRTNVIMYLPQPFKEYFPISPENPSKYFSMQKRSHQVWHLNAQLQMLPKNIIFWDSFIPFSISGNADCLQLLVKNVYLHSLPNFRRFKPQYAYGCLDKLHQGFENINSAVQMLLNHFCNSKLRIKKTDDNYCCSKN